MGAIFRTIKMALANEDTLGKVFAGSSGKNMRQLIHDSATVVGKDGATTAVKGYQRFSNFVNLTQGEVESFDKAMNLATDVFNKDKVGKDLYRSLQKDSRTFGSFNEKIVEMYRQAKAGSLSKEKLIEIFGDKIGGKADNIVTNACEAIAKDSGEIAEGAAKSGVGFLGKAGEFLKGKGGTIGIILTLGLEGIDVVKAFKNGDGFKQIGRSSCNLAGFAGGAAVGAAIGSVIPVAGTAIGGLIGGICGFVGGMAGGAVGSWLGKKFFGTSIADKKDAAKEQQEQQAVALQQMQQLQQAGPKQLNAVV